MDLNQKKEQYSNAFVHAAAAVAGFATSKPSVDDDSVDWTISQRGGGGTLRSPKLDVQLKCTEVASFGERCIKYSLPVKNYEDLRPDNVQVPRILVLVTVPKNVEDWLLLNDEALALKNCAYWVSLRGHLPTENVETVTVELPRSQRFDPMSLSQIMDRIGSGDLP